MSPHPTLIVGGGPSGSVTALLLARAGRSVVLVDRREFPRPKACGECANPGTIEHLRELELTDLVRGVRPGRLRGWSLTSPDGRAYRAAFPDQARTWTVDRSRFDHALLEAAAEAGADVRTDVAFEDVETLGSEGGRARLRRRGASRSHTFDFDHLVGADGLHSRVRSALDLDAVGPTRKAGVSLHVSGVDLDPSWGYLHLADDLTIGLAPLDPEGGRWTLVLVTRATTPPPTPAPEAIATAAHRLPALGGAVAESDLLGCGPFDRPVSRPWRAGALLVGDAAGYFDPVTGQGIGRAIGSARRAADALLASGGVTDLARYARRLDRDRRGGVRVQRLVDRVLRRPALLERLLPILDRSGALADLVAVTGDHMPSGELLRPSRWLRWARSAIISTSTPPTQPTRNSCAP